MVKLLLDRKRGKINYNLGKKTKITYNLWKKTKLLIICGKKITFSRAKRKKMLV